MSLLEQFSQAQADSKTLEERPGMTDFVARAKFDAWAELQLRHQ